MATLSASTRTADTFQEIFVPASSVDERLYQKVLLRVSELDSPVVQATVQVK